MPCSPVKARKLLRDKKAVVKFIKPFTIQLTAASGEKRGPLAPSDDPGYLYRGLRVAATPEGGEPPLLDPVPPHKAKAQPAGANAAQSAKPGQRQQGQPNGTGPGKLGQRRQGNPNGSRQDKSGQPRRPESGPRRAAQPTKLPQSSPVQPNL